MAGNSTCLNGTSAIFVGISETIELLEWMMGALRCCHRGHRLLQRFKTCSRKYHASTHFRSAAICKQNLYSDPQDPSWNGGYYAECSALGGQNTTSLDFRWKTDMRTRHDEWTRKLVLERAAARRTVIVLGGGVSHFTRHADYPRGLNVLVPPSFELPQHWVDDYVNATEDLFRLFAPASLPSNVCVLWKPINIAVRHNGSTGHHPSSIGGVHDWLNKITATLARREGILPLDTASMLRPLRPRGFRNADPLGRGGSEGDPYHGFNPQHFAPQMVAQLCALCRSQAEGGAGGHISYW